MTEEFPDANLKKSRISAEMRRKKNFSGQSEPKLHMAGVQEKCYL